MADGEWRQPRLRRLAGSATTHGIEFEFKTAGLVALRARRRGLRFEVNTNVALARPLDDVVVRVRAPCPCPPSDSAPLPAHQSNSEPRPPWRAGCDSVCESGSSATAVATSSTDSEPIPGPTPMSSPFPTLALAPDTASTSAPTSSSFPDGPESYSASDISSTPVVGNASNPAGFSSASASALARPALALVQLFHAKGEISLADFKTKGNKLHVEKFFEVFQRLRALRLPGGAEGVEEEEWRFVCECAPEDVFFVLCTTRTAPAQRPRPTPPAPSPPSPWQPAGGGARALFEYLLRTDDGDRDTRVLSFTADDTEVWNLRKGQEDEQVFREEFLPRFFVLCGQAHADALDALLGAEMQALSGGKLHDVEDHVRRYVDGLKHWAQQPGEVSHGARCLTNESADAEVQLARGARRLARLVASTAANGIAPLVFSEESCRALREALRAHHSLSLVVPGVPAGLRATKLLQVLKTDFHSRWLLVTPEVLAGFPRGALVSICEAPSCALLAVDAEGPSVEEVVAAAERAGRRVVRLGSEPRAASAQLVDRWTLQDLVPSSLSPVMQRKLLFQGTSLALRDLESTWPSLRAEADGELLGALLARGDGATLGAAPPAPDVPMFLARTLRHANVVDPEALFLHGPSFRLAFSGFSRDDLRQLRDRVAPDEDLARNSRWVVLSWAGEGRRAADDRAFEAVAASERAQGGRSLHWLKRVDAGSAPAPFADMTVVWKKSSGPPPPRLLQLVRTLSARCQRQSRCVHACHRDDTADDGLGRVALVLGEPGAGKSTFLRHAATVARRRQPTVWSVFVEVMAHRQRLRDLPSPTELDVRHVVELLAAAAGATTPAARRCLEAALLWSGAIQVFVDGIDEVCPTLEEKTLRLLELLIQRTKARVIRVSSRTEVQMQLQRTLHCACTFLEPLTPEAQVRHLSDFWATHASDNSSAATGKEAFEPLAAELVQALAGDAATSLLAVPLYSRLAAEALANDARAALREGDARRLGGLRSNLFQLYCLFVSVKRDQYLQHHGLTSTNLENSPFGYDFDAVHQNCAMLLLVSDGALKGVNPRPFEEFVERQRGVLGREKTGLVWLDDEGTVRAAHFSFVEFFAAAWLAEHAPSSAPAAAAVQALFQPPHTLPRVRHFLEHKWAQGLPLHEAALAGDDAALEAALEAGAVVDALDQGGRSALHLAAARGWARAMRLLAASADAHRRCALLRWTPLQYLQAAMPAEWWRDPRWQEALDALPKARAAAEQAAEVGAAAVAAEAMAQSAIADAAAIYERVLTDSL